MAQGADPNELERAGLLRSGQPPRDRTQIPYALSREVTPTVNLTWFQANMACIAAGKRLPTGAEWLAAAAGTEDDTRCNIGMGTRRPASRANRCTSLWGAHDMIGNLWEWTNEWYASVGAVTSPTARPAVLEDGGVVTGSAVLAPPSLNASITGTRVNYDLSPWPANSGYGDGRDITRNITSTVGSETGDVTGMPAVAIRGGGWGIGATAGTFALSLTAGPSARDQYTGFRCVIPR